LNAKFRSRAFLFVASSAWIISATGCVQPLGPGFRFSNRQTEIYSSPAAPDTLHVRVVDRLENDGDRTLSNLDVRLPEGPNFGAQNFRITVAGKSVLPRPDSIVDRRMMRLEFDPPWEQKQPREISDEWNLTPSPSARGTAAASANGFYLADETALPTWQIPAGIFAKGGPDPDGEVLSVFAPPDFRVLAAGTLFQRKIDGAMQVRKFRIRPKRDFRPYAVAGRYLDQTIRSRDSQISFWTFRPLDPEMGKIAAVRLALSVQSFVDYFGPLSHGEPVVHIVEAPGDLPSEFGLAGDPGGTSFPLGALMDSSAISDGIASEAVLELAEYELARTWFGWRVRSTPEAQILMGRGVGLFGLVIAAEARESSQQPPNARRRDMVARLVERYDRARSIASDRRLMESASGYSRAERISNGYRAALFFVALEDLCGRDNLRAAFRYIVEARAGEVTGYEELRAALESSSHRDLAEMFRHWLIQPGLPDDFRARYSAAANVRAEVPARAKSGIETRRHSMRG
jgi:hypothetical protein